MFVIYLGLLSSDDIWVYVYVDPKSGWQNNVTLVKVLELLMEPQNQASGLPA
jgi:hypothetical protein